MRRPITPRALARPASSLPRPITLALIGAGMALTVSAVACGGEKKERTSQTSSAAGTVRDTAVQPSVRDVVESVSYAQAQAAFDGGHYPEATELFGRYSTARPKSIDGHYMLGLSAWKAGNLELAESAFVATLQRDPNHLKSRINLSRVLLDRGQPGKAADQATTAVAIDPRSSHAYRIIGRVRSALGQFDGAQEAYTKALTFDETDVWSMNNLGHLLIQQGRFDEAIPPLARATQLRGDVAVFQNNLGVALERTGHFVEAAEAYRAAIEADSTFAKSATSLARVERHPNDSTVTPIDLAVVAQDFATKVEQWQSSGTFGGAVTAADSSRR